MLNTNTSPKAAMPAAYLLAREQSDLSEVILVDVSAFCHHPCLTGIQRQLEALMRYQGSRQLLPFIVESNTTIRVLPRAIFGLIGAFFSSGGDALANIRLMYHGSHPGRNGFYVFIKDYVRRFGVVCEPGPLFREIGAILVTEYIMEEFRLDFYLSILPKFGFKSFFIEHDFVFWTLRRHFSIANEHIGHVKHLQLMRRATNIGCVSTAVADDLRGFVRRDAALGIDVITPGGNSLGVAGSTRAPETLRVAIVGTIEPRKCSLLVLDVLENLSDRLGLEATFCGTISDLCSPAMVKRFAALEEPFLPIRLIRAPSDAAVREVVLSSTVTVYLSDGEGFGVPPLESLGLGVPVITTAAVPSLEGIPDHGQVRLQCNTAENLSNALLGFADREYAQAKRLEAAKVRVPTWQDYANQILRWVDRTREANWVTHEAHRLSEDDTGLTQMVDGLLAEPSTPQGRPDSKRTETSSAFDRFGVSEPPRRTRMARRPARESGFLRESRLFCEILAGLYRCFAIFETRESSSYLQFLARAFLKREGSPEEFRAWRQGWSPRGDAFNALVAFHNSEESNIRYPNRPPQVGQILENMTPVMTLILDDISLDADFIFEAYRAILGSEPDAKAVEAHLLGLTSGVPEPRLDLLRSLLCSDPALERRPRDAEEWGFLLAELRVATPYWELGRAAHASLHGEEDEGLIRTDLRLMAPGQAAGGPQGTLDLAHLGEQLRSGNAVEWLPIMKISHSAVWVDGVIEAKTGPSGHIVFGPYFRLPAGKYSVRVAIECGGDPDSKQPGHARVVAEAVSAEPETYLAQQDFLLAGRGNYEQTLSFEVTAALLRPTEIRVWSSGDVPLTLSSISVQRVSDALDNN